jgi:type II secretory ATPase GspE/PulE/Tfp pilus assembly ATPase PilB-like protein
MDIAETRLPQDGNFNVKLETRSFEIRVSTFPTIYGENGVLRRQTAKQTAGMISLREDGLNKVLNGMTTLEEVNRVAYKTSFDV